MIPAHSRTRGLAALPGRQRLEACFVVLALGVALRFVVADHALRTPERHLAPDSLTYLALAENLSAGRGFSDMSGPPWTPNTFRTLGYPAYIALVAALLPGRSVDSAVVLAQATLILVTGAAILGLARRLGLGTRSRLVLSSVIVLDPGGVGLGAMVLSESLFTAFMAIALLAWLTMLQDRDRLPALLLGLLVGALALIRPVAAYFWAGPLLTLALIPVARAQRRALAALVIFGTLLVTAPWLVRNHILGAGLSLSSMARSQMIHWQAAVIESRARGLSRAAVSEEYLHRYGGDATGPRVLVDVISRYPAAFVGSIGASFVFFFADPGHQVLMRPLGIAPTGLLAQRPGSTCSILSRMRDQVGGSVTLIACACWTLALLVLAGLGLYRCQCDPEWRLIVLRPAVFTIAYFASLSLLVVLAEGGARLRAPILPVLALLAAVALEPARMRGGAPIPLSAGAG